MDPSFRVLVPDVEVGVASIFSSVGVASSHLKPLFLFGTEHFRHATFRFLKYLCRHLEPIFLLESVSAWEAS